jgi:hypothetical protein
MANYVNTNLAHPVAGVYDHKQGSAEEKLGRKVRVPALRLPALQEILALQPVPDEIKRYPQVAITLHDKNVAQAIKTALEAADEAVMRASTSLLESIVAPLEGDRINRYNSMKLDVSEPATSRIQWDGLPYMIVQRNHSNPPKKVLPVTAETVMDVLHEAGILDKATFALEQEISRGMGR